MLGVSVCGTHIVCETCSVLVWARAKGIRMGQQKAGLKGRAVAGGLTPPC